MIKTELAMQLLNELYPYVSDQYKLAIDKAVAVMEANLVCIRAMKEDK